jgi:hypothetical protein
VGVGIEGDVGDREPPAGNPLVIARSSSGTATSRTSRSPASRRLPGSTPGRRRPYISEARRLGPLRQVDEDRVRLGQRPAVVEDQRRHPQRRVEAAENRGSVGAVEDIELSALVVDAELRQQQPDLVAVAR